MEIAEKTERYDVIRDMYWNAIDDGDLKAADAIIDVLNALGVEITEVNADLKSEGGNEMKPVIPREVADAIEWFYEFNGVDPKDMLEYLNVDDSIIFNDRELIIVDFAKSSALEYAAAIVNGYEIEKSAEELAEEARQASYSKIREIYEMFGEDVLADRMYRRGVRNTLDNLNVKIPGVNA